MRTPDPVAVAYADMLSAQPWHWFCTLTFRPQHEGKLGGVGFEKADKAYRWFVKQINADLWGNNWKRKPHGGLVWARGQEFHKSGRIHFHAVMASPVGDLNEVAGRYRWHEFWYREFGRNQIERPNSQSDVLDYVSKYVTKDGEVDFSPNFGQVLPPALF